MQDAGPYIGLAWQMLSAIVVFGGGGLWLDRRFGWTPWGVLGGMGLACVAIGTLLYRALRQSNAATARRNYAALRTGGDPDDPIETPLTTHNVTNGPRPGEGAMKSTTSDALDSPETP